YHVKVIGYWSLSEPALAESGEYRPAAAASAPSDDLYAVAKLLRRCLTGANGGSLPKVIADLDGAKLSRLLEQAAHPVPAQRLTSVAELREALARCRADSGSGIVS